MVIAPRGAAHAEAMAITQRAREGINEAARVQANLRDADDVRELLATIFEKDDRALEAESSLEQADLVHDVGARDLRSVRAFVVGGHDQEGECRLIEHRLQALLRAETSGRLAVELVPFELEPFLEKLLQDVPHERSAVTDEDLPAASGRPSLSLSLALRHSSAIHAVFVLQTAATREFNPHEVVRPRAKSSTNLDVAVALQDLDYVVDLVWGQVIVLQLFHGAADPFASEVVATAPLIVGGLAPLGHCVQDAPGMLFDGHPPLIG